MKRLKSLPKRYGCFTANHLMAGGFEYTGENDKARCNSCGLEVSNWTLEMNPFDMHRERSPNCQFVLSHSLGTRSSESSKLPELYESNSLMDIRIRGFLGWPSNKLPSSQQMVEAGFFCCDVGDRVICIYCDLVCQQWTAHVDVPNEVHRAVSPNCIYVKSKLSSSSISTINENYSSLQASSVAPRTPCNPAFSELPKRYSSFANWSTENLPSVEDLVQAGFFYTGTREIVSCFYCNGSLHKWGPNDNPKIEHVRFFPHCAYARQYCGEDLYQKVQRSKRVHDEKSNKTQQSCSVKTSSSVLTITDRRMLDRLVAARLDLPVSQRLLDTHFKVSIIKRCWENQLMMRRQDYFSDSDLYVACFVLKKQVDCIDGKKENICVPSIKMEQIKGTQISTTSQSSSVPQVYTISTNSQSSNVPQVSQSSNVPQASATSQSEEYNLCSLCLEEKKSIACIPCGHLISCVPCGHSLKTCPICRRHIEAFVKIYV